MAGEMTVYRMLAMRRLSVLLTAIGRRLGGVFELSFGKKNMLTKLKERLARRRQLAAREGTLGGEGGFGGVQEVGLPPRHGIGAWVGGEEGGNMAFHMLEGGR